ncbi:class I SAM-dependent methyltransferase [Rhodococcus sp. DK176]|uniref:class I SAM-dependent methyltransferase n=1 Tax=unclassified Rhodococcus (in: high G+C Gram-positive bacteria) TaxID=192944 RepID=UPI003988D0BA
MPCGGRCTYRSTRRRTFSSTRSARSSRFEVDQPGPQTWKRNRLIEPGFGVPDWLRLVPVDFEASESCSEQLAAAGFDSRPRRKCCPWPARPASPTRSMWRELHSPSATSPIDPTARARRVEKICWWPLPERFVM